MIIQLPRTPCHVPSCWSGPQMYVRHQRAKLGTFCLKHGNRLSAAACFGHGETAIFQGLMNQIPDRRFVFHKEDKNTRT